MTMLSMSLIGARALLMAIDRIEQQEEAQAGRALVRAGNLVDARAKEILTEKGHVKTGTLRRSLQTTEPQKSTDGLMFVESGSDVFYSIFVELLPDGGYLYQALREMREAIILSLRADFAGGLR
jgi:hypothetical protein